MYTENYKITEMCEEAQASNEEVVASSATSVNNVPTCEIVVDDQPSTGDMPTDKEHGTSNFDSLVQPLMKERIVHRLNKRILKKVLIIKAIHEPASHFYNHDDAGKSAALLDLSTAPTRRFTEIIGDHHCHKLLNEVVGLLNARHYKDAERVIKQAVIAHDVVAAESHLAMCYIGLDHKKKAFGSVDIAVAFGSVPLMYTLSAMYRCGYGVKKSNLMADAWYWKAVELDIDNRGLKTAIIL